MNKVNFAITFLCLFLAVMPSAFAQKSGKSKRSQAMNMLAEPKTLEEVKKYALGEWQSISVELRPTEDRAGIGKIQPNYLTRQFTYLPNDKFIGKITLFADNYGKMPLMEFEFKGSLKWGEKHPIADGAWKIDYVLDEGFGISTLYLAAGIN